MNILFDDKMEALPVVTDPILQPSTSETVTTESEPSKTKTLLPVQTRNRRQRLKKSITCPATCVRSLVESNNNIAKAINNVAKALRERNRIKKIKNYY